MNKYLESVKEFHEKFNHPVNEKNSPVSKDLLRLRIKLIFEELHELSQATGEEKYFRELCGDIYNSKEDILINHTNDGRDRKEEIDALCDITVVTMGSVLVMGHQDNFDDAFDEVHRSNMSKMCNNLKEAEDTQKWYVEKYNTESIIKKCVDKWMVLRKSDNKILKNKYYSPADLGKFV